MNKGMQRYLDSLPPGTVKHMTLENCPALVEYERQMREETIPAIMRALKAQQRAAHFFRLGIPDPLASVGRNPKGQDRADGLGRNDEHAVGAAETPEHSHHPRDPDNG